MLPLILLEGQSYLFRSQLPNHGRRVWRAAFLCSLVLLAWSFNAPAAQNILLVIADDYGAGSSRLYNSTNSGAVLPPTPNIESLAASGVVFRRTYANPVCSPTRACLLTGQYGFRTGIGTVVNFSTQLTTNAFTLPEAFARGAPGYALAQFGKWHLATAPDSPNVVGGWPLFAGVLGGAVVDYFNWTKTSNGTQTANYTHYVTTDIVDDATKWIQARGTNPWLAWVAFNAPHEPLHLPPTNLCPHYSALPGTPSDIDARPTLYYDAMVEAMDTEIGRLLASVDRSNTHIIFIGDNGTPPLTLQPPYPAGRGKGTLYEGGLRVPLVIAGPAVVNPNRTNDTLVTAVDLFATILELVGTSVTAAVPTNVVIDGCSLVPALSADVVLSRRAYSEAFSRFASPGIADGRALRDDRYKLIHYTQEEAFEFYDLQIDPYEATNLVNMLTGEQRQYYNRLQFWFYGYTTNTGPRIASASWTNGQFTCTLVQPGIIQDQDYALWRCEDLTSAFWSEVNNAVKTVNGPILRLRDVTAPSNGAFYSVVRR
jgi:arylsulfatase A-like enzyme